MGTNMRAIIFTALGLAAAAPALAGNFGNGYLGLRGSYIGADEEVGKSVSIDAKSRFENGWGGSAFYGTVFSESLRGEIEAGYRVNDIETVTILRNDVLPGSVGLVIPVKGEVDMGLAMASLYYDFPLSGLPILPWVGIGAGGANVNYSVSFDYGDPLNPVVVKDSEWQFAYQLMAGVTVPVGEMTSMTLGYRYFATEDMTFVAADGSEFDTGLTQHSVDVGLQFHL